MIKWILLALLLLLVLLHFFLRIGAEVCYDEAGPRVKLRLGPKYVQVWPSAVPPEKAAEKRRRREEKQTRRKAKKQAKKEAKAAKKPPKPGKKITPGGALSLAQDLLPTALEAGRRTKERLQIDRLILRLTWGEEDPADAAIHYGQAWAVLEGLLAVLEGQFTVKEKELSVDVDFVGEKKRLYAKAGLSLTPAQMAAIGFPAGVGAIKALLRWKKESSPPEKKAANRKKEVPHGKESSGE